MKTCFSIVADALSFEVLRGEWNALVAASPLDHAFMRHEWFSCWLSHLGNPAQMRFIVGRQGSRLVAAAPMQIFSEKFKGMPARVLGFAGSTVTPRCNVITASDFDVLELFRFMLDFQGVDLVIARGMARETSSCKAFCDFLGRSGQPFVVEVARRSPYLATDGTWHQYVGSLSKSFQTILKRGESKLSKAGAVRYLKIERHEDFAALLPKLVAVSANSWKAGEQTDLQSLPQVVRFLDEFSRVGEATRLWEAWVLFLNEEPIAFDYYLRGPRSLSLVRTDFDLRFKDLSPGNNLQMAILRDVFGRQGAWEYDMGGQAYDYKMRWTDKIREHVDVWTAGRRPWGKLLLFGKRRILPHVSRPKEPAGTGGTDT